MPIIVSKDQTLRVKITDVCGLACTFCHNEGTPVASDNTRREPEAFTGAGRSGRVSIYIGRNGANFLPATIEPDAGFANALAAMADALGSTELHLTGGEPTLHPRLVDVVKVARYAGYEVCMTSNGENGAGVIEELAAAGLDRINFSIFGTTPGELAAVQSAKYANPNLAAVKLANLRASIGACAAYGVKASANIVVPDERHAPRVRRLLDEYTPELSVRLLNSLDDGQRSIDAIHGILDEYGAVHVARYVTAGASGFRDAYRLPSGRVVYFKQIRPVRLPDTCTGCRFNNDRDCTEGYYGVRLYRDRAGKYQVGVCIQRMDLCLPLDEFIKSTVRDEVLRLRESDALHLPGVTTLGMEGN